MSSNYPPGVSGNEPEIVGHDEEEVTLQVTCDTERRGHFEGMGDWEEECGWTGDVVGTRVWLSPYEAIFHWECPACQGEHEDTERYDPELAAQEAREDYARDEMEMDR